jgi:hypothetical protein
MNFSTLDLIPALKSDTALTFFKQKSSNSSNSLLSLIKKYLLGHGDSWQKFIGKNDVSSAGETIFAGKRNFRGFMGEIGTGLMGYVYDGY